jgi:L-lysine 2,3-aminomutase
LTQQALARLRSIGATLYSQAPLIRRVNDDAGTWRAKWALESRLGVVPYYMFVERDTGPWRYFAVPLADAVDIFTTAYGQVGGLARTVRGPVMSTTIGKLHVARHADGSGHPGWTFALTFLRARDPVHQGTSVQAHGCTEGTWVSELCGVTLADRQVLAGAT